MCNVTPSHDCDVLYVLLVYTLYYPTIVMEKLLADLN